MNKDNLPYVLSVVLCVFVVFSVAWNWHPRLIHNIKNDLTNFKAFLPITWIKPSGGVTKYSKCMGSHVVRWHQDCPPLGKQPWLCTLRGLTNQKCDLRYWQNSWFPALVHTNQSCVREAKWDWTKSYKSIQDFKTVSQISIISIHSLMEFFVSLSVLSNCHILSFLDINAAVADYGGPRPSGRGWRGGGGVLQTLI